MGTIILSFLKVAVKAISPELRNIIVGSLASWADTAEQTASPWDDLLVQFLSAILDVE